MAFGNATKGYVKAHSGGGGSGTDNYNNLSNKPKINGVALTGNKTSSDLHIESGTDDYTDLTNKPSINGVTLSGNKTSSDLNIETGTDDYEDLTNKPSINGVELLGDKVIGLLSGNIQVDYTKLTDLPSINGVTLTGNKTSSDLHITGGGGSSDYTELTNKPSINGVELLGDKEVGLLSGNIHVDYSKLTNLPSINGVSLSGNKTSIDLGILGSIDHFTYVGDNATTGQYIDIGNHTLCLIASRNYAKNNSNVYALYTNTSENAYVFYANDEAADHATAPIVRDSNGVKINSGNYELSMNYNGTTYDVYLI